MIWTDPTAKQRERLEDVKTDAAKAFLLLNDGTPTRSRNANHNLPRYQLYRNLMLGGTYVTRPHPDTLHPLTGGPLPYGSYLVKLPMEIKRKDKGTSYTRDPYQERCDRASHRPVCRRIISTYTSTYARQPVDRSELKGLLGDELYFNIDLKGTSAPEFILETWAWALDQGWTGVMTHLPEVEVPFASALEEEQSGIRPWAENIVPMRFWDWRLDPFTGLLRYALIDEGGDGDAQLWRAWSDTDWALINNNGDVIKEGQHSFGRVPIDILTALPADRHDALAPLGESTISDAADLEIEMFNVWSLHTKSERLSNFRFLHADKDIEEINKDAQKSDKAVGEEYMMYFNGRVGWVEPNPAVTQENRDHLKDLEQQILRSGGVDRRSADSVESHSGLALEYEYQPKDDYVRRLSMSLLDFERRFWRTFLDAAGKDVPDEIPVRYPSEITTAPTDVLLAQADKIVKVYGSYSSAPEGIQQFVNTLMERAARHEVGHLPVSEKIIEKLRAEADKEPPPEPPTDEPVPPIPNEDEDDEEETDADRDA